MIVKVLFPVIMLNLCELKSGEYNNFLE
jgi:hypothetical protein